MKNHRLKPFVKEIFSIVVILNLACGCSPMVIYGPTDKTIDDTVFGCAIGDSFTDLPANKDGFSRNVYKDHITYTRLDEDKVWNTVSVFEKDGKINCIHLQTLEIDSKRDARRAMEVVSKKISDDYTSGKGLRAYKRSRNYVYNKEQGIIQIIRLERTFDSYTINIYIKGYSWWRNLWDGLVWRNSFKRPGFSIGRIFIGQ